MNTVTKIKIPTPNQLPRKRPDGLVYSSGGDIRTTIGDDLENANKLTTLRAILELEHSFMGNIEPLPPTEPLGPDATGLSSAEITRITEMPEFLPEGEGGPRPHGMPLNHQELIKRSLQLLLRVAEEVGNGSGVYDFRFEQYDKDSIDGRPMAREYLATIILDENGQEVAFVADSNKPENAIYVWRKDINENDELIDVIHQEKATVKKEHLGLIVIHTGSEDKIFGRIMRILKMSKEEYLKEYKNREQANARRRLGSFTLNNSAESN